MDNKNNYHKILEKECAHFLAALRKYPKATLEQRKHLGFVMGEHLGLVLAAVKEIPRSGIGKEGVVLEKSYRAYVADPSDSNYAAVEHAAVTLQDFNM